ncbi:MAG: NlpC/P60 family protein [Chloroflexota bacterium]|nr:NlpC/P60 family protein [Chloroflexota bacterium]
MNVAPIGTRRSDYSGLRGRLMLVLAISVVLIGLLPGPVQAGWLTDVWPGSTAEPGSEAAQVLDIAHRQVGKPYKFAAVGPDAFDCSGLIWYVFKTAGLADRMGDKRRGATAYLNWFKLNLPNQVSPNLADARPGDILIWGGGRHAGIYISGNWAVSALNERYDIRIHRADPMGLPFTAVLKVNMSRNADPDATPDPNATPSPTPDPNATPSPTPAPVEAPMPPTSFSAAAQPELTVALDWDGATGTGPLKYRVYRNGVYYVGTKLTTLLDHPWLPGKYDYSIQTVDANGAHSFRSVVRSVTVLSDGTPANVTDTTAPTVPTGLTAESLGDKQVALSWQPSTDSGPSPVGYLIKRGTKIVARVWTPTYVDRPTTTGTYSYTVVAFDGYGNNVASDQVDGTADW